MILQYIEWMVTDDPRGVASLEDYIKSKYSWLQYKLIAGNEAKRQYVSLLVCADDMLPVLTGVVGQCLRRWDVSPITPKRAAYLARLSMSPRTECGIQYGHPYLDVDGYIKQDSTHLTKDSNMISDDQKEQEREARRTAYSTALTQYANLLNRTDAQIDAYIDNTVVDLPSVRVELKRMYKIIIAIIRSTFVDVDSFYR